MKYQTFEEYLSDKCDCHTNNDPAGFDNWVEALDVQDVIDFAEEYGKLMYEAGKKDNEQSQRLAQGSNSYTVTYNKPN